MHRLKTRRPIRRRAQETESDDSSKDAAPANAPNSPDQKSEEYMKTQHFKNVAEREKKRENLRSKLAKKKGTASNEEEPDPTIDKNFNFWKSVRKSFALKNLLPAIFFMFISTAMQTFGSAPLLTSNIANMFRPELSHSVNRGSFFEGWYIKSVEPSSGETLIVIPGLYTPDTRHNMTEWAIRQTERYKKDQEKYRKEYEQKLEKGEEVEPDPILDVDYDDKSQWPPETRRILQREQREDAPTSFSHAYVMVLRSARSENEKLATLYYKYSSSEFQAIPTKEGFSFKIGNSLFSNDGVTLDLAAENLVQHSDFDAAEYVARSKQRYSDLHPDYETKPFEFGAPKSLSVKGQLAFAQAKKVPKSSPSTMGPISYSPFLEYYQETISQTQTVSGSLTFEDSGDKTISEFKNGSGFIRKDWGYHYPKSWIKMQTNVFRSKPQSSLSVSITHAPLLVPSNILFGILSWLPGSKSFLYFNSFLITFYDSSTDTTYNLSKFKGCKLDKIDFSLDGSSEPIEVIDLVVRCPHQTNKPILTLKVKREINSGFVLPGPSIEFQRMAPMVEETADAAMLVKFEDKSGVLFEDVGLFGSVQIEGAPLIFKEK
ncbi:hypothetical protein HK098_000088 [Nowakowskiella sp. JEL0407]|nr:hypothetical protein HK098_000088 [Nowakowskiella sp. JEL0407]